mmetsp:Transcript_70869/g.163849  ORF Transcript_70869/g.163849 Transcript_70869/m.163849 type:complete len:584 (-) Transcript_70869:288-2039(-)
MNFEDSQKLVRLYKQDHPYPVNDAGEEIEDTSLFWVDRPSFNVVMGLIITANAVIFGLETAAQKNNEPLGVWIAVEALFAVTFVAELICRLYYHKWSYFGSIGNWTKRSEIFEFARPNWSNILDALIVAVAVVDTFILAPIGLGGQAKFAAFLRFFRLTRLIRLLRLFKIFRELYFVTIGLLDACKTLFWVCIILVLLIEICAIITTRYIGHNDSLYDPYFKQSGGWDHEIYFKTVGRSMFTLFQIMTLDSWSDDIVRHVGVPQPGMLAFFIAFIVICNFLILNVVVGVVIESTLRTARDDDLKVRKTKEKRRQMVFNQLREIFEEADVDASGTLTLEEVLQATNRTEVYNKLKMIDFPVDDPEQIFNLLDFDGCGELTIEEFITGCIRMKGPAKSKDLLVAQVAVNTMRRHFEVFDEQVTKFNEKIHLLDETARALLQHGEHVFLDTREYRLRHPSMVEATVPRLTHEELMQAPWMQEPDSEEGEQVAMIADYPRDIVPSDAGMLANRPSPGQPVLMNVANTAHVMGRLMDAPHPAQGRLLDAPNAPQGRLMDVPHNNIEQELALMQIPGAMPPSPKPRPGR